jgi:hypothetical protein
MNDMTGDMNDMIDMNDLILHEISWFYMIDMIWH